MEFVSRIISSLIDALRVPFGATHHTLGLAWLSLLAGVGMACVFKLVSDRRKIRESKDRFKSFILEMRIYQDDPRVVVVAFFNALRANLVYLRRILVPFLVLIVPAAVIFMQLDERYGRSHIPAGSTTLLTVVLAEGADPFDVRSSVACGPGVSVDAGPVRIRGKREIDWRLKIDSPGTHAVTLSIGGHDYRVPLVAEPAHGMIGSARSASSFVESFLHPGLSPIPENSPIEIVKLHYPGASYPLLFWRVHWIVIFLVYSLVGAMAVKLLVGFEI